MDKKGVVRIPLSTYRLQFNADFTFKMAGEITDYLAAFGVSHCYASPLFKAGAESTHGYDVCGFEEFNSRIGTIDDFREWAKRLQKHGLGLLIDMVPNHMGNELSNCWWADVLEQGERSHFAEWFDIDWHPSNEQLEGKVLLPILGARYSEVLHAGKLQLEFGPDGFVISCYDLKLPVSRDQYPVLIEELTADFLPAGSDLRESLLAQAEWLGETHNYEKEKKALVKLLHSEPAGMESIGRLCDAYRGKPGDPTSFDRLHGLLQGQHYRLAYWRVGPEEINYRRFFDITGLVSMRVEFEEVFQTTHQLTLKLVREGKINGLRIDHPDGLWDPKTYFERLREGGVNFVVVEKILSGSERLPADWPVEGTTGYDFLNVLNGLFVAGGNADELRDIYRGFTGHQIAFADLVYECKKLILAKSFRSEHDALARRAKGISGETRFGIDFTWSELHRAIGEVIATFPVYRTYIQEASDKVASWDAEYIKRAIGEATRRNPDLDEQVFSFLESLLLLNLPEDLEEEPIISFVMKFQQLTGPVMAKGLEDTAFYRYFPLLSLNEVGGEPDRIGITAEEFHAYNSHKAQCWPHSLLATATHDTKRGEDVRARINVLSEIPHEWKEVVAHWQKINGSARRAGEPHAPSSNDEYLLYQTLVGVWPFDKDAESDLVSRVQAYIVKAIKEAKVHTNWIDPNPAYEEGVQEFVQRIMDPSHDFLNSFRPFQEKVAYFGMLNSLAQLTLKATSPGIPDFYQGTELWDFSLVDPDNRRPVDFSVRKDLLQTVLSGGLTWSDALTRYQTGEIKLLLTHRLLELRKANAGIFTKGNYEAVRVEGPKKDHVIAFSRTDGDGRIVVAVPRLCCTLLGGRQQTPLGESVWGDTRLELGVQEIRNALVKETIPCPDGRCLLNACFRTIPLAVLEVRP